MSRVARSATDAWTAAQVEKRRNLAVDELLAESDDVGTPAGVVPRRLLGPLWRIRGALQQPGARESAGVAHAGGDGAPTDATEATQHALATWSWPPDDSEPAIVTASTTRLTASPFELL